MSLFSDNLEAFGLDLSDHSIKIAQLKKKRGKTFLYSHIRKEIPEGLIKDGEIRNEKDLAAIIKNALSESKPKPIRSKFVVYSIPETKGFIRVIKLPHVGKSNIADTVIYEAEQMFPINISESYLDWQILPVKNSKELKVLVAAVPKKLVDSYSSTLKSVGLKPVAAEIESIAISRSLINKKQFPRPILIIDFGKDRTSFIIFKNPAVQFTASIPVCGEEFDKKISKKLKIDMKQAEKIRQKYGLVFKEEHKEVYEAMQPSLAEIIKYINKLTNYYKEHYKSNSEIAKVIICGGESRMVGISSFLSLKIKKEIEKGNPWTNISSDKLVNLPISRDDSLVFVTVLGLAIRGVEGF